MISEPPPLPRRPYVIGLTGNIATGKSQVLRMLAELGAYVIDADRRGHALLRRGGPVYDQVVATFGPAILDGCGQIDRQRLGAVVFSDPQALRRLEKIVHPGVIESVHQEVEQVARDGSHPVVVIEAIKLIEAGMVEKLCDELWVVHATAQQQVERLVQTRGLSPEEARRRMAAQPPQREKEARADWVIDNSGALADTRRQLEAAWARVTGRQAEQPEP
ncbi:MAG: dephospho-CoA kinase [Chloroflexi bacterium]|nr:dephospho-CoA kinase [Chloroflexota bacterium]